MSLENEMKKSDYSKYNQVKNSIRSGRSVYNSDLEEFIHECGLNTLHQKSKERNEKIKKSNS